MSRLLQLNFRKLRRQRSLFICLGIILAMLALSGIVFKLMASMMDNMLNADEAAIAGLTLAMDGVSFGLMGVDNGSFVMIMGVIIALMVCDDYEQHIVKVIFARGYTRLQFYFAKLAAALVVTTACFVVTEAVAFGLGAAFFGAGKADIGKLLAVLGVQYVAVLANAAFIFFLSSLFRKTGLCIAAALVAPTVITLVLQLVDAAVRSDSFRAADYWISSCFSSLYDINVATDKMLICLGLCVAYAAAFIIVGALVSRRTEV